MKAKLNETVDELIKYRMKITAAKNKVVRKQMDKQRYMAH